MSNNYPFFPNLRRLLNESDSRNCQVLPEGMDNFQIRKNRRYVLEKYGTDVTLLRMMKALEQLFGGGYRSEAGGILSCGRSQREASGTYTGSRTADCRRLVSTIVDEGRFEDSEKFCVYFGLVSRARDSGGE